MEGHLSKPRLKTGSVRSDWSGLCPVKSWAPPVVWVHELSGQPAHFHFHGKSPQPLLYLIFLLLFHLVSIAPCVIASKKHFTALPPTSSSSQTGGQQTQQCLIPFVKGSGTHQVCQCQGQSSYFKFQWTHTHWDSGMDPPDQRTTHNIPAVHCEHQLPPGPVTLSSTLSTAYVNICSLWNKYSLSSYLPKRWGCGKRAPF